MSGRSRLLLLNTIGAAVINVALGVVLVPRHGIMGAAISVLVSGTALQVALTIEAWIVERVHPFTDTLLKPAVAALVMLVVESVLHHFVRERALRIVVVIAGGAVSYVGALVLFGLAPEERRLATRLLGRLRPRDSDPPPR
jgi:O-antigen/teichoic acid export membrane protein